VAEGVGGPYCKVFLHKVKVLALVAINLLALIVRNTIATTPFRILAFYHIKKTKLSVESKIQRLF
jgi:hypothetical protein